MLSLFISILVLLLGNNAFALQSEGRRLESVQVTFPSGTAKHVSYIRLEDDPLKIQWISQLSDPDDVCRKLGLGKSLYDESDGPSEGGHLVIDGDRLVTEPDVSSAYGFIVCTVPKPTENPKVAVDSKVRNKDGSIEMYNLIALRSGEDRYRLTHDSDLTALCKLLGYSHGVSATNNSETSLWGGAGLGLLKLSAEGQIVSFSWEKSSRSRTTDIPSNHYIENLTCRK